MNNNGSNSSGGNVATRSCRLDTALHQKDRQERFLAAFAACGSVLRASRSAKVHRQTHYFWMQEDPTYPPRFKAARQCAAQALEDEAVRRAHEGIKRPLLHKGKQVYINGEPAFTVEYSDQLLMFLLKAWKPELYREHFSLDVTKIKVEDLSDEQLEAFVTRLLGETFPNDPAAAAEARKALEEGRMVEVKVEGPEL